MISQDNIGKMILAVVTLGIMVPESLDVFLPIFLGDGGIGAGLLRLLLLAFLFAAVWARQAWAYYILIVLLCLGLFSAVIGMPLPPNLFVICLLGVYGLLTLGLIVRPVRAYVAGRELRPYDRHHDAPDVEFAADFGDQFADPANAIDENFPLDTT